MKQQLKDDLAFSSSIVEDVQILRDAVHLLTLDCDHWKALAGELADLLQQHDIMRTTYGTPELSSNSKVALARFADALRKRE